MAFIDKIKEKAKADIKTIVLPESEDDRTILAAAKIVEEKIANIVIIGPVKDVQDKAAALGVSIDGCRIVDPADCADFDTYVNVLYEARKNKGMTPEAAREILLKDYLTFGIVMVKNNDADGMVAGASHATSDTLRPALQIIRTAPGVKLVSAFFVMDVPDCEYGENGTFIFADSGLNQDPDCEQLAAIADSSAKSFEALTGAPAKVAMISHSTKGSATHALVDKVLEALRIAKEEYPYLAIDGELQVDAAIVPSVASSKAPGSEVAGHANVLIFPNLDAGNSAYKLVQRLAKAEAYGPMLQGIARPVNDLSRGCSYEDIVGVVALTAVQAQM